MIRLVLTEICEAMDGTSREPLPPLSVGGVSTDSRSVRPGELFFALHGPRFDGHDFVGAALQRGAVAAVVRTDRAADIRRACASSQPVRLIEVPDVVAALGRLAAFHRSQTSAQVIAVVGSNGKTTTKEMIGHILRMRLSGRCSPKSFNNAIGVPLTLLSAEAGDDFHVVEIGTNSPGEVTALAKLVQPDLAVVTSIAEEHLEGLGDLHGVAAEEMSILRCLRPGSFAAVNIDTPQAVLYLPAEGVVVTTFGTDPQADLRVSEAHYREPWLHFVLNERFRYRVRMAGAHNALNAAAAIAVARRFGFQHDEIAERLASFRPPPMRTEVSHLGGVTVVNDAYNANPRSALAAIEVLESLPARGRRIAVFGEMRELGRHSPSLHEQVARRLRKADVAHVLLVGAAADWMGPALREPATLFEPCVEMFETVEDCGRRLADLVRDGDVVLLKASRAVGLEQVLEPLRRRRAATPVG